MPGTTGHSIGEPLAPSADSADAPPSGFSRLADYIARSPFSRGSIYELNQSAGDHYRERSRPCRQGSSRLVFGQAPARLIAAAQRVHRGEVRIADLPLHQIRQAMTPLNDYRNHLMLARNWGITDLYNAYFHEPASQLAKHHQALDALVLKAYDWKASEDILRNLLDLNLELAEREAAGEKVVGPWAPA
jgi:hypothetical protein